MSPTTIDYAQVSDLPERLQWEIREAAQEVVTKVVAELLLSYRREGIALATGIPIQLLKEAIGILEEQRKEVACSR
jgi:hypothetical protein